MITVRFQYLTGIRRRLFRNSRLAGSWNAADLPMQEITADDGCPAPEATVVFDDGMGGQEVRWGVRIDGPSGATAWAPNAQAVDVVFGTKASGYIYDDGRGTNPSQPVIALNGTGGGIWASGTDLGNYGAVPPSQDGPIELRLSANGLLVLRRT